MAEALQYVLQGASGWIADRLQRDKPVALVGYAVAALAKPAIGLATGWPLVLVGRGLDRLATGVRSAPRDALVASSINEKQRGAAFGLEGLGDNLGAVGGPLLATALLFGLHLDLRWIFYLALVPGLLSLLLLATVREVRRPDRGDKRGTPNFRLLPARYWIYLIAIAVFSVGNSSNAFIILKASNVGIPNEQTVLAYAGFNLVAAIASYPAGSLSDSIGRKPVFLAGLAIFVLAYIGFGVTSQSSLIALLFALYGAYQGVFRSVGKTMATDLAPNNLRATSVGLYSSVVGMASLIASLVGGELWQSVGPTATFAYGAVMAALGAVVLAIRVPNTLIHEAA